MLGVFLCKNNLLQQQPVVKRTNFAKTKKFVKMETFGSTKTARRKLCNDQFCGSRPDPVRSGPFWSDPDPCPLYRNRIWIRNLCCLTFWFMNILSRAYFRSKHFLGETWRKIYKYQDPDVFKSRILLRIPSNIARIRNTDHDSSTKRATLLAGRIGVIINNKIKIIVIIKLNLNFGLFLKLKNCFHFNLFL
jgi:hypothetical protein